MAVEELNLVVGLGKTGVSIAKYLQRHGKSFVIFDTRSQVLNLAKIQRQFAGVEIYLEQLPAQIGAKITRVIASPGVDCNEPSLQFFAQKGIPIIGDIELFAQHVQEPIVAITGTNGKSTVTELVGEMARKFGINVAVAGNIGTPVLDLLDADDDYSLWVLELSSFQLNLVHSLRPKIATILNISPDHLDRHGTFANYAAAKQRVYHNSNYCLYNRGDSVTIPQHLEHDTADALISFGLDAPTQGQWGLLRKSDDYFIAHGDECLFPVSKSLLKGTHNWLNLIAASAIAHVIGIDKDTICAVLTEFSGLPHRCRLVRVLDGVEWVDDSKGTNVGASIAALQGLGPTLNGKIVLIAGGQGKGGDFYQLQPVVKQFVKKVLVFGDDAEKIADALGKVVEVDTVASLPDAVLIARKLTKKGDMVLLSPACASFDMFRDYRQRGDIFAAAVERM